jgi:retron-type reverse transcriptase
MRRATNLWSPIISFANLLAAARTASLGKRATASVARFLERLEPEAVRLQFELATGVWRPSRGHHFTILDPKPRVITVVPFRDQVVQHALIRHLEPVFERRMIFDSYACRRGKGTHAALRRARGFVRRHRHFLKLDVRSFFASVRHDVVMETLVRVLKDRRVLALCECILSGPPEEPSDGVGLPLGSLTSQWFANMVLDRLDHHVKEVLRVHAYVRYMDDLVLAADGKAELHDAHASIGAFLRDRLSLALKDEVTMLAPVTEGLPFLGWRIFRGTVRLRPENLRRYFWRLRFARWQFETGRRTGESYRRSAASVFELLRQGNTLNLRRSFCERHRLEM